MSTITIKELIEKYNTLIKDTLKCNFLVRATELQEKQIKKLIELKNLVKSVKYQVIEKGDESTANMLFHLQCVLNSYASVLEMWVLVKKDKPTDAWDKLIDARAYLSIAFRAADDRYGLDEFRARLEKIEETIVPRFSHYISWSAIIKGGKCTICGNDFDACEHIEDLVYWGKLCVRIQFEIIGLDHVALVEEPRDKRCIIQEITTEDGYYRNYLTWRKVRKAEKPPEKSPVSLVARIFNTALLEIT